MLSRPATTIWRIFDYGTWKAADALGLHAEYFSINNRLICYFSSEQKNWPWSLYINIRCTFLFKHEMQLDMHDVLICLWPQFQPSKGLKTCSFLPKSTYCLGCSSQAPVGLTRSFQCYFHHFYFGYIDLLHKKVSFYIFEAHQKLHGLLFLKPL